MTDPQRKRLYFPAWRRAFAAAWVEDRGIVRSQSPSSYPRDRTTEVGAALAQRRVRRMTAEDLRHACNAIAMQRERSHRASGAEVALVLDDASVSSARLSPLALELWLCWVQLIEDDTRLDALIKWENPEDIERERIVRGILAGGAAGYAARLSADIYGTSDWQGLPWERLLSLHATLRQRRKAWREASTPNQQPA